MYNCCVWPGAYSFKSEIKLFIQFFKKQFDLLLLRIEQTEAKIQ